ncbi:siderophore ABC transporter substrate-binding protein [Allofranklinella schreckenbergeri]|uniref:Siderophore ABC transporter substrate-binding protein n=1 Tax=Allofranklinella schreckenbergeri TaxID=1076744 RepID=A0A3M6Q6U5_9BURK|nr:siderophore ABC transporter substrate-binding protein [Allofranklinella schreckenbergeri]RMW98839.1 siderophore ABC transporter substrate-binding protein [Allofranklinella schreckenbergeri]
MPSTPLRLLAALTCSLALTLPAWAANPAQPEAAQAAAPSSDTITFRHAKGEATLPRQPQRAVVFDLATLDMLAALGVDAVAGVPAFKMPGHLQSYGQAPYAKVGSLFEPDYEAIRALDPQVIFVGRRTEARIPELSKLAPTVDMAIDESQPVPSIYANLRQLGALFGKQAQAEQLIAQAEAEIAALRQVAPGAGKAMLLLISGGRINSYGPGSRMGMVFDTFGLQSAQASGGQERHGQSISFEYILQANPDWLLVLDRDAAIGREGAAAQRLLDNALIKATNAGKKGQIAYLDATNWYVLDGAGITALRQNVKQLHDLFTQAKAK